MSYYKKKLILYTYQSIKSNYIMSSHKEELMNDKSPETLEIRNEINSLTKEDQKMVFDLIDYLIANEDKINSLVPQKVTNKERLTNLENRVNLLEKQANKK